uniref:SCP domain-containing protein n=1 Tax=Triatoma dimidiata TaxID=72491 RepID=D1MWD7_TRIDM|nr:hypothetical protein Td36 similar to antigen 5-like protein [Triatoma dimidiata]
MAKTHVPSVFSLLALALIGTLPSSAAQCRNKTDEFIGDVKLTKYDKEALLRGHNNYRQQTASGRAGREYGNTQPAAKNMLELTWDDEAAQLASSWARTCEYGYNKPTDKQGQQLGQNIISRMSTEPKPVTASFDIWMKEMMMKWFDQVNRYEFGSGLSSSTRHYTRMVWAKTSKLGCGYSYYTTHFRDDIWQVGYLVCNYKPSGNIKGKVPYEKGDGNCETDKFRNSSKYMYLCVEKQGNW